MQDFGITRIADLGEAQFLDLKFDRIINLCGDIVGNIYGANAMYVTTMLEYDQRRLYIMKYLQNTFSALLFVWRKEEKHD